MFEHKDKREEFLLNTLRFPMSLLYKLLNMIAVFLLSYKRKAFCSETYPGHPSLPRNLESGLKEVGIRYHFPANEKRFDKKIYMSLTEYNSL
jgi:hypothetical protein